MNDFPRTTPMGAARVLGAPLLLTLGALLVRVVPGAGAALQYDRGAIASGEAWRLVTGHWTHWTADHLFWDLSVFAILAAFVAKRSVGGFLGCTLFSSLAIGSALWGVLPDLASYRGLSGVDSALFATLATGIGRDSVTQRDYKGAAAVVLAGLLFLAKTLFEVRTGSTLFVGSAGPGLRPVALAHAVGAAVGLGFGLTSPGAATGMPEPRCAT